MTGAGCITKTKPHLHIIPRCDHTTTTVLTRAAKAKANQSGDANIIDASKVHTPQRANGTNGAAPMAEGVTVTPPAAKHNTVTTGHNGETESDDGGAQTPAMEVEIPNTTDKEKLFSLTAAKGIKDADAKTAEDGHTNGKARPETPGAEVDTTDGEVQAGSKHTRETTEEENPIDAFKRRATEAARRIRDKKRQVNHKPLSNGPRQWTGDQSLHQ